MHDDLAAHAQGFVDRAAVAERARMREAKREGAAALRSRVRAVEGDVVTDPAVAPQPPHALPASLQFLMGQLVWLAPLLWLAGCGLCLALLLRSRSASAALLGGIWVLEIIFKNYLAATDWLHPVLLFPTTLLPLAGRLPQAYFDIWLDTRLEVLGTGLALCLIGWLLMRNPEGLLKGASEE